ncbi:hypothetical protein NDU88_007143 [Pleurodeles waltl]|uniref:Uncharacterized protein n=1 Tax=Pleurodeles waltl TaxID=8319 RepID=A0AAV7NSA1_PLEWA|nr:hypothetical protein NDU88_007143 [Pleurodeles waltl]
MRKLITKPCNLRAEQQLVLSGRGEEYKMSASKGMSRLGSASSGTSLICFPVTISACLLACLPAQVSGSPHGFARLFVCLPATEVARLGAACGGRESPSPLYFQKQDLFPRDSDSHSGTSVHARIIGRRTGTLLGQPSGSALCGPGDLGAFPLWQLVAHPLRLRLLEELPSPLPLSRTIAEAARPGAA